jgi:hypothetical protein
MPTIDHQAPHSQPIPNSSHPARPHEKSRLNGPAPPMRRAGMFEPVDAPCSRAAHSVIARLKYAPEKERRSCRWAHVTVGTNWGPHVMRDGERPARLCTSCTAIPWRITAADLRRCVTATFWGSSGPRFSRVSAELSQSGAARRDSKGPRRGPRARPQRRGPPTRLVPARRFQSDASDAYMRKTRAVYAPPPACCAAVAGPAAVRRKGPGAVRDQLSSPEM